MTTRRAIAYALAATASCLPPAAAFYGVEHCDPNALGRDLGPVILLVIASSVFAGAAFAIAAHVANAGKHAIRDGLIVHCFVIVAFIIGYAFWLGRWFFFYGGLMVVYCSPLLLLTSAVGSVLAGRVMRLFRS